MACVFVSGSVIIVDSLHGLSNADLGVSPALATTDDRCSEPAFWPRGGAEKKRTRGRRNLFFKDGDGGTKTCSGQKRASELDRRKSTWVNGK
jgi:hypothetical protein